MPDTSPAAARTDARSERPRTKRILELDALRAIAALNLLVFHFTYVFPHKYGFATPLGFELPYGKYGVQLFFMLSGFVNAMTLLKKRQPGEFLVSRFIRIFPAYWLVIVLNIFLLSSFAMFGVTVSAGEAIANFSVMPRLFGFESWEPVTWTLQIEMLFYGILMLLFMGGAFENTFRNCMILLGISGFGILLVGQLATSAPTASTTMVAGFLSELFILKYLPLFITGILLHEIVAKRGGIVLNSIGILAATGVFHLIDDHGHNPVATVVLLGLLTLSAYGKLPPLRFKPLMFISSISYSLYLFHNNLGCLFIRWIHDAGLPPLASILVAFAISVALAAAITFWFERPITGYLRTAWKAFKNAGPGLVTKPNAAKV